MTLKLHWPLKRRPTPLEVLVNYWDKPEGKQPSMVCGGCGTAYHQRTGYDLLCLCGTVTPCGERPSS